MSLYEFALICRESVYWSGVWRGGQIISFRREKVQNTQCKVQIYTLAISLKSQCWSVSIFLKRGHCFFFVLALSLNMWNLSSPTRGRTHAPCSGNVGSSPLDLQGSPKRPLFCIFFLAPAVPFEWTVPSLPSPHTENEDAEISLQESDAGSCFQCPIISHQHGGQDKVILFKGRGRWYHSHAILAGSKCGGRGGVGKSFVVGALCPLGGREASSPLPALSLVAFSEEYWSKVLTSAIVTAECSPRVFTEKSFSSPDYFLKSERSFQKL